MREAHAWVRDEARSLRLDDALDELDATNAYAGRGGVHAAEDIGFDLGHFLPVPAVVRTADTAACQRASRGAGLTHGLTCSGTAAGRCLRLPGRWP